ncbi:MAG: pilin [Stagnimonas sp.]|nr:pilin [Stagnimonas sp.]
MNRAFQARSITPFFVFFIALISGCAAQKQAEQLKSAQESVARLQDGVVDYATSQQHWPKNIDELKVGGDEMPGVSYVVGEGGVVAVYFSEGSALPGARLVYTPTQDAQAGVTWACASQGLDSGLKPVGCL